jgi:hypothetical protein
MGKTSNGSKSKKGDRKARSASSYAVIDLVELKQSAMELCSGPPMDVVVPLDAFRARLDAMPCSVCKEWAVLAWLRWSNRETDVKHKPWYDDLKAALSDASEAAAVETQPGAAIFSELVSVFNFSWFQMGLSPRAFCGHC